MWIPKNPYPLFACKYASDYVNEWNSCLAIFALQLRDKTQKKLVEVIHPWDYSLWIHDEDIGKILNRMMRRNRKEIYAISNWNILPILLWVEHLEYYDDDTWYRYSTLDDHDINCTEGLLKRDWWNLIPGKDEELLDLFLGKKHK